MSWSRGTSYFPTWEDACAYFSYYEDPVAAVREKLAAEEIHIGKPGLREDELLYLVDECPGNRYYIRVANP